MASFVTPKKNTQFIFYIGLVSQADTNVFQANPTIAAGDFKVSTDGSALGNLNTLPAVDPAGAKSVKITLSAAEMNGDNVQIIASDAAGAEWCDAQINVQTTAQQIDTLASTTIPVVSVAGAIGSLATQAKADVNAEVVDCLNVDTYAEPTGAPGATTTIASKLGRLYQVMRNKMTVTSSAKSFTNDAGAALWSKGVSDDGTTYTENEGS